jgi:hypothetical protein
MAEQAATKRAKHNRETLSTSKIFSGAKFVSANHILQICLTAENFLEWKWTLKGLAVYQFLTKNVFKHCK